MNPPNIFELSKTERASQLWLKISEHLETRIKELRERNDSIELDDKQTLKLRTEISVYKTLLKL